MLQSRRTPHGVRGLKFFGTGTKMPVGIGRTPHGVRGLKSATLWRSNVARGCRTPHGVRGLKFGGKGGVDVAITVAPRTGCVD